MDAESRHLLAESVTALLAEPPEKVDDLLTELGWDEVVADDPATAVTVLFTQHGRLLGRSAVLDRVVLGELAPAGSGGAPVADAVCYPAPAAGAGLSSTPESVDGVLLRPLPVNGRVAVPVRTPDGGSELRVVPTADLRAEPLTLLDTELAWFRVTGSAAAPVATVADWAPAAAAGRRALAAEVIGASREALRLAVEHTSLRVQFGQPIASFQAVRHMLADAHTALVAAEAVLEDAFLDGSPLAAVAAKAAAGRAQDAVIRSTLQSCGAIGSTYEHPLHRYVNRVVVLDALLGNWRALSVELGRHVLTERSTPRVTMV